MDGLTKALNSINPKSNVATASGYQTLTVRIFSPYPD
jgi:hypothetical protein